MCEMIARFKAYRARQKAERLAEHEQELRALEQRAMRSYYSKITEELHAQKERNRLLSPDERKHWLVAVVFMTRRATVCARLYFKTETEARAYMHKMEPLTVDLFAV